MPIAPRVVMAFRPDSKSSCGKKRDYRQRLREQSLRPIQIWVPDVHSPAFRSEAHRQSLAVASGPYAVQYQIFLDSISDWWDE